MYILIELQTTDNQTGSIVTAYTDRAAAESACPWWQQPCRPMGLPTASTTWRKVWISILIWIEIMKSNRASAAGFTITG